MEVQEVLLLVQLLLLFYIKTVLKSQNLDCNWKIRLSNTKYLLELQPTSIKNDYEFR